MFQQRIEYIGNINKFIKNSKDALNDVLDILDWHTSENSVKSYEMVSCPNDESHRVPKISIEKHVEKCTLRRNGYEDKDNFFPPAPEPVSHMITIDAKTQESILKSSCNQGRLIEAESTIKRLVPQTSDRLFTDLTKEERCVLYDYAVKNTTQHSEDSKDFNLLFNYPEEGDSKPKSLEEILAAERDAKRRRVRYKAKKVHTSKKTQSEILREVIHNQMEGYEEWLKAQGIVKVDDINNRTDITDQNNTKEDPIKTEEKNDLTVVLKGWDDWSKYLKDNPHKRYTKILEDAKNSRFRKECKRTSLNNDDDDCVDNKYVKRKRGDGDYYRDERYSKDSKCNKEFNFDYKKHSCLSTYDKNYDNREKGDLNYKCNRERNNSSDAKYEVHYKSKRRERYVSEEKSYDRQSFSSKGKKHKHDKYDYEINDRKSSSKRISSHSSNKSKNHEHRMACKNKKHKREKHYRKKSKKCYTSSDKETDSSVSNRSTTSNSNSRH